MTTNQKVLPTEGALTFLFTDIEGSTRKAHELGEAWFEVLETHHAILRPVFASHGGAEVSTAGDSFFIVFEDASQAVGAAVAMQHAISGHDWSPQPQVRVRMGLHTGPARFRAQDNDYAGLTVHAASRVESAAAGAQVLITQATLDAASERWPSDIELIDLGFHRLKDLPAELKLYQVAAPGLEREFPPVRGLELARNNVPVPPSTFIGRTEVLSRLHRLVDDNRLVSIVGTGGTGKTRVALRLATERLSRHGDGVWFVELAAAYDHDSIVAAVADAVGVKEDGDRGLLHTLVEHLRDKTLLLVIDNCEQVIDDAAAVVEQLLESGVGIRVVTTSREPLELDGERVWPLQPLGLDDADPRGGEAVALLADRISLVQPDFELTPETLRAAVDIARRLDGLPLALELAAASAVTLTLAQIARQLDERFELLTRGKRTAVDRQKTLWGAIDWSYSLLSDPDQRLFRSLGVFPSEFDFGVVREICSTTETDVDEQLPALVRKSLVVESPSTRLRLLESIRAYAREQAESHGELAGLAERHARYFVASADKTADTSWIDTIHEDLSAARRWGVANDRGLELAALEPLQHFWMRKGRLSEGRHLSEETLAATTDVASQARWNALTNTGHIALLQGDTATARQHFEGSATVAAAVEGDEYGQMVLGDLGDIAAREGDFDTASLLYERALNVAQRIGKPQVVAVCLAHLAQLATARGDLTAAWHFGLDAIEIARAEEMNELEFAVTNVLGTVALQRGQFDDARRTFSAALAMARKFDLLQPVAYFLYCLACVELAVQSPRAAAPFLREAIPVALEIGAQADVVESLEGTARIAVAVDAPDLATTLLASADAIRDQIAFARDAAAAAAYAEMVAAIGDVTAEPLSLGDAAAAAIAFLESL